jgi:predicted nucleic acid-binding protein
MSEVVCLDTNILIWAIKEQATPGQEAMIARAKRFLRKLDQDGAQVIIPSLIIAELLMPVPVEHHAAFTNLIERSFIVAPFDVKAAIHFVRIWQQKRKHESIRELVEAGKTKGELKADAMIVAIAVSQGASCLYTHDGPMRKVADGFIRVSDIPDVAEQADLPLP